MHDAWLRRRITSYWETPDNHARRLFQEHNPVLNAVQQRVLADMTECGIAQIHFDELFPDHRLWDALKSQARLWLESEKIKAKERRYLEGNYHDAKWKEYLVMMTAEVGNTFSLNSPLLLLAIHPALLDIVNSYFGMMARLFHLDVWKTIPLPYDGPLTGSQRWHRDPEDVRLVKVFFYLTDVDETAGPLHYVKYSRRGDKYGNLWRQQLPYGNVASANEVEIQIPRKDWSVCTAPAGTIVFADTTGLHMGGRASKAERVFATWGFASQRSPWPRSFKLSSDVLPQDLSFSAQCALFE